MGIEGKSEIMREETISWLTGTDSESAESIQELVRVDSQGVPRRYVRNEEDRPLACPLSEKIPVISFDLLASGDEEERHKLHFACKDWGFFQLVDHGIEERVLRNIKVVQDRFFDLPYEEKRKHAKGKTDFQGYGQGYIFDDEQKLDWNDSLILITTPTQLRNIKFWPTLIPNFMDAVEEYSKQVERLYTEIFANLSLLMGMKRNELKEKHMVISQGMGMNYYPPCARPDLVYGISLHSDACSMTLLLQDDNVNGLQIKHKGEWVPVNPVPNAVLVNIGDAMEGWSNGMYKSIDHRAVTNKERVRKSIATFIIPQEEAMIGPVETMVDDSHPRRYKDIKYIDYAQYSVSHKLDGRANTEFLKLSVN